MSQESRESQESQESQEWIIGRNAVREALSAGRAIERVLIASGATGSAKELAARARAAGIPVKSVDAARLNALCGANHQGIAAAAAYGEYASVPQLLEAAKQKNEPPLLIVCDGVEDPRNLGAILRTADAAGAHGVVAPKRRSAGLTAAVAKSSAGAAEYVPVARVSNIAQTLRALKEQSVWVYGLDMGGSPWCEADFTGACAIVVGSEGRGLSRLTRDMCDRLLSLPMRGKIGSLNVSVACGAALYEAVRQRHFQGG